MARPRKETGERNAKEDKGNVIELLSSPSRQINERLYYSSGARV